MNIENLISAYRAAGQGQVFAFWEQLDAAGRARLAAQAAEVVLAEIAHLHRTLVAKQGAAAADYSGLQPAPYEKLPEHGGDAAAWARARAAGEATLREGRVAAFTVAGGQGTRLGYDGPKGTFAVTPVRKKPLFQVFAEKIKTAGRRFGKPLHWFIMTSHANHEATEAFFAGHAFFGLDPGRVHCFRQGRMPAVDFEGNILLETKSSLALSPDGHGGSLRALRRSGALDLMKADGVDTLSYFQVDNPLVRCVDPAFIGWHRLRGSEMSSKMAPKAHAGEKVGHFCVQDGRLVVVEYSDLPLAMQRETGAGGSLRFNAGSIAIHVMDREFARRMAGGAGKPETGNLKAESAQVSGLSPQVSSTETRAPALHFHRADPASPGASQGTARNGGAYLPFHRADKKIAAIDVAGNPVKPAKPNGVKFEMFVFDALPFAKNPVVIETARADDFSPVKNAGGVDSPQTCRDDQCRQFTRWLKAAGVGVPADATGLPPFALEVSPLFADDARSFGEAWSRLDPKPAIQEGLYLGWQPVE